MNNLMKKNRCEDAFRKGIESPLEESLLQRIIGKSRRVNEKMIWSNLYISENDMEALMKRGEISVGFSDSPVWSEILEQTKKLPKEQEEIERQFETLKNEEQLILNELKLLKERTAELEDLLKTTQVKKNLVEIEIQPWIQFKKLHYQQTCQFVQTAAEKEKKLAKRMDECRLADEEFTANCSGDAPLSLVFNAIGLSDQSIKQLQFLDEFEFLNTNIQTECRSLNIPIREQFELAYCQKLWITNGCFPNKLHEEDCVVCAHHTPEELCFLIAEHEKSFDIDWIKRERITGRQFVGMPAISVRSISTSKEFQSTWMYFQRMHNQSLKSGGFESSIRPKAHESPTKKPASTMCSFTFL